MGQGISQKLRKREVWIISRSVSSYIHIANPVLCDGSRKNGSNETQGLWILLVSCEDLCSLVMKRSRLKAQALDALDFTKTANEQTSRPDQTSDSTQKCFWWNMQRWDERDASHQFSQAQPQGSPHFLFRSQSERSSWAERCGDDNIST